MRVGVDFLEVPRADEPLLGVLREVAAPHPLVDIVNDERAVVVELWRE